MSIQVAIAARVLDRRLRKLAAALSSPNCTRKVYLATPVSEALQGRNVTHAEARLFGVAQARLEQFANGDEFVCRRPPSRKATSAKGALALAMLEPAIDEVWEMPVGTLRLFGRFAERGVFVVTNWGLRQLLGTDERKWRFVTQTCITEWTRLFHPYAPLRGIDLHEYLGNARPIV